MVVLVCKLVPDTVVSRQACSSEMEAKEEKNVSSSETLELLLEFEMSPEPSAEGFCIGLSSKRVRFQINILFPG